MNLRIHSIESFGTVDGPGVRFVIFTQGCPLRCQYCHNPDTWDTKSGYDKPVEELIEEIDDLVVFMGNGGVTITGGEPLLQPKPILALFKVLKEMGIHTAIDTSGFLPINEDIKEVLQYTDLVLLDIKVMDEDKHKTLTGLSNQSIFEFASYLDNNDIPIWVRHVILPTINDSEEDLSSLKSYIDSLKNLVKIEVLPYHELGIHKWDSLNMEYKLKHITPPSKQKTEEIKQYLRNQISSK